MWYIDNTKPCCLWCYYVYIIESDLVIAEESQLTADYPSKHEFKHHKIFKVDHGFSSLDRNRQL